MRKKTGVNILLFVLILQLFFAISCIKSSKSRNDGVLIKTDQLFSDLSEKEGMHKAFLSFFADSGVMLRDNGYPIKGRGQLMEIFSGRPDTGFTLVWKPVFEKIAERNRPGDICYDLGKAEGWDLEIRDGYRNRWPAGEKVTSGHLLFLASDANIPKMHNPEKIMNPVFILCISPGYVEGDIFCCPI
jgi:hypothetical protein